MTWKLSSHKYVVFNKNPLRETNLEIRFHPILSISDNREKLSSFQDLVREHFPIFEEGVVKSVDLSASTTGNPQISEHNIFSFSKSDNSQKINLSNSSLLLTTLEHKSRDQISESLAQLVACFNDVYGVFNPTRLGVRYINIVSLQEIRESMLDEVSWEQLIKPSYLHKPDQLLDINHTVTRVILRSSMSDDKGELNLQYGFNLKEGESYPLEYVFDVDRFVNNPELDDIQSMVLDFTSDIYSIFLDMAGDKLVEWMS